jgi:hypothetical protein
MAKWLAEHPVQRELVWRNCSLLTGKIQGNSGKSLHPPMDFRKLNRGLDDKFPKPQNRELSSLIRERFGAKQGRDPFVQRIACALQDHDPPSGPPRRPTGWFSTRSVERAIRWSGLNGADACGHCEVLDRRVPDHCLSRAGEQKSHLADIGFQCALRTRAHHRSRCRGPSAHLLEIACPHSSADEIHD